MPPRQGQGQPPRQGQDRSAQRAVVVSRQAPAQQDAGARLRAVTQEIDNRMAIIGASAAAGIRPERLKLVALTAFTRVPALLSCEPVSIARAIVEAGQLGLEPTGLMGGAYLVPRGGKATLLVGYRGLVILARRSGEVQRVEARVVRAKDIFEYGYGLDPYLRHVPSPEADPGPLTHAYAVIFYRDGSRQFDVMTVVEIEAIRKRSSSPNDGPWVTDYFEMCKKTPLRRLMKMAPLTIEVARALDELDPEVDDAPRGAATDVARQRAELQDQLSREYGDQPLLPAGEPATTHAAPGTASPGGQAGQSAEGVTAASSAGGPAQQEAGAPGHTEAPAPAAKPESVARITRATCGLVHEGLGVGPCVLPAGHERESWSDPNGTEHSPQAEHEEAGGTRWTQPRGAR